MPTSNKHILRFSVEAYDTFMMVFFMIRDDLIDRPRYKYHVRFISDRIF